MKNRSGIIFVGGIHGVGKSTVCKKIGNGLNIEYLSASEILKWEEINSDSKDKRVEDVDEMQDRLIMGLENIISKDKTYLLDGHFCLLNSENEAINVPLGTFKQICPLSLVLILDEIPEIKRRLEIRDKKSYQYAVLKNLQDRELSYAKHLSKVLGVTLNIGDQKDYQKIIGSLRNSLKL
ncbi:ATP-binding protein [Flavivirga abyssicola]|uniref:ATP-binding protein n=1 Tax=Flavivirga abyssicola TaxID=3063533 RepID=UPI0026E04D4C|nr:ATP-binding protein [Flavivirga sp. MEBiC07777]WVK14049.1 ATP-binding protein [Flavivirga sp. MEBiC07777]